MDSQIDFSKPETFSQYGIDTQRKLAKFSESILSDVKNRDTAEIGALLNELMLTVKGIDLNKLNNPGVLKKVWYRILKEVSLFKGSFDKVNDQLDFLIIELELAKGQLIQDLQNLEKVYESNIEYLRELEQLITDGENAIQSRRSELDREIFEQRDLILIQKAQDDLTRIKEFEKRIHDLKLTRMITLQSLPQIRLIQHNHNELINKIQSSLLNTIPVWKNQMVLAMSIEKQKKIAEVQKKISETTNNLITKNSEILKQSTIDIAKLSKSGVVEVSSLQRVNDDIISLISNVMQIYEEGREKRKTAEVELQEMERRLKAILAA